LDEVEVVHPALYQICHSFLSWLDPPVPILTGNAWPLEEWIVGWEKARREGRGIN